MTKKTPEEREIEKLESVSVRRSISDVARESAARMGLPEPAELATPADRTGKPRRSASVPTSRPSESLTSSLRQRSLSATSNLPHEYRGRSGAPERPDADADAAESSGTGSEKKRQEESLRSSSQSSVSELSSHYANSSEASQQKSGTSLRPLERSDSRSLTGSDSDAGSNSKRWRDGDEGIAPPSRAHDERTRADGVNADGPKSERQWDAESVSAERPDDEPTTEMHRSRRTAASETSSENSVDGVDQPNSRDSGRP